MAEPKIPTVGAQTPPPAKSRIVVVKLRDLPNPADILDEFAFRFPDKYSPDSLYDLMESIKLSKGLYDGPHIFKRPDGKWVVVVGHRRVAALYLLAKRGVPDFSLDMNVSCTEVTDVSRVALMGRSMASNELGLRLDPLERLMGVKLMDAEGATKKEISVHTKMSEKQIQRDLLIVRNDRVLQHVKNNNLLQSDAATLTEAAVSNNCLDKFLDYFDGWVIEKNAQLGEQDRRAKQERGKGLKPNQMLVANQVESHIVKGWVDQMAKGKPFTEEVNLGFEAVVDKQTSTVTIRLKMHLLKTPVTDMARAGVRLSHCLKEMMTVAQTRHALETPIGAQATVPESGGLNMEILSEYGLDDVAMQLTDEMQAPLDTPTQDESETETQGGRQVVDCSRPAPFPGAGHPDVGPINLAAFSMSAWLGVGSERTRGLVGAQPGSDPWRAFSGDMARNREMPPSRDLVVPITRIRHRHTD